MEYSFLNYSKHSFAREVVLSKRDNHYKLLGIEGAAARQYFKYFSTKLKKDHTVFQFKERNRRPPKDPINAMLSYIYALLAKELTITLLSVGFDPYLGFLHRPRYGRPALALDMMEEFRPIICDAVVISSINNRVVTESDFVHYGGSTSLSESGKRKIMLVYEKKLDTLISHPVFKYPVSYRRILEIQCRLLARYLYGDIPEYPVFTPR